MEDLTDLPILPREDGREWPQGRSWTDTERLELRDMQLRQALEEVDLWRDLARQCYTAAVGCAPHVAIGLGEQYPELKHDEETLIMGSRRTWRRINARLDEER